MANLYPRLHEKFKSEGLCPICLMEMAYMPRFSCGNRHVICHRCRPYYYSCPQCLQPLTEMPPQSPPYHHQGEPHVMPQPWPYQPSAPSFQEMEQIHPWHPPSPPRENQELIECSYSHLGCTAKFVPALRDMHVSRCQYKQHGEGVPLTCSLPVVNERSPCRYQSHGCNVRASHERLMTHEGICIYKDRIPEGGTHDSCPTGLLSHQLEASCHLDDDPSRLVECRFRSRGCMVRMPHWRKQTHEDKCNYNNRAGHYDEMNMYTPMHDSDSYQVECRWAGLGCRVRPYAAHKLQHESKCNYRMEECCYRHRGCMELVQPSRKYVHEGSCRYAY